MKPLNGTKTHPLSVHALKQLHQLSWHAIPTVSINPGITNRLLRENLAEIVSLPSPFKTHKGGNCNHLQITTAGREALTGSGSNEA